MTISRFWRKNAFGENRSRGAPRSRIDGHLPGAKAQLMCARGGKTGEACSDRQRASDEENNINLLLKINLYIDGNQIISRKNVVFENIDDN